ncbi:MAG: DUF1573 domain-containing protein [Bacteroidia bacterium]|nr:DUF1573 domain-containing protein [Bacteroidia bacterium]
MKRTGLVFLLIAAVLSVAVRCKQESMKNDGLLSTEIVNNPVSANGNANLDKLPKFEFANKTHDFGVIIEGEKVSYSFKFKNTGKSDLIISSAKGSCGCTVPKYDKEPIAPGKDGFIEVIFDSSGKSGMQSKTITVMANTQPNTEVLTVMGEVVSANKKQP